MALFSIKNIALKGLACAVPKNQLFNRDYPYHTPTENKQFLQTTGIEERRIVTDGVTASDLCFTAAKQLLDEMAIDKDEINVLIFLSQTPDYKIPCTATILQDKLGLSRNCIAFDINLGCSGYVYGMSIAASLLQNTKGKAVLLVGDISSRCVSQSDKTVAPLFSDAGSCTVLSYDEKAADMHFNLQSDGKGHDAIKVEDGGARNPATEDSFTQDKTTNRSRMDMFLDGIKVFNFSRKEVAPNLETLLNQFDKEKSTIDYFIFHQANLFMNESIRKKLKLEATKVPYSIKQYGNTSSASIPVTLIHSLQDKMSTNHLKMVFSGFGVGLSWGSLYIETQAIHTLPMIEV
ncbi:MAG: 3-oxoacyl-ACP synthase III family protein [Chitinophagales bacterium]